MKRFIINFAATALLFFTFFSFNINVASAQKIVCETINTDYTTRLFLFKYNDDNKNEGYIWVNTFIIGELSNDDRQFLEQINGQTINEGDSRYSQVLDLTNTLHELDYNPLMSFTPTRIIELNAEIFEILRSFSVNN